MANANESACRVEGGFIDNSRQNWYTENALPALDDAVDAPRRSANLTKDRAGRDATMTHCRQHPGQSDPTSAPPSFDDLYTRHEQGVYALILRMVGNPDDAVELTSQTFLHALRAFRTFRGDAQVSTWLYRIAANVCKNFFRSQARHTRPTVSLDAAQWTVDGEYPREIPDSAPSPHLALERLELQAAIRVALQALTPELRMAIVLRDVQGCSYQEITEITGSSLEAVKSRIFRARGMLRTALAPQLDRELDAVPAGRHHGSARED